MIGLALGTAALVIVLASVPLAILLHNKAYAEADQHATYAAQASADYLSANRYDNALLRPYLDRLNRRGDVAVTVLLANRTTVGAKLAKETAAVVDQRHRPSLGGDDDADNLGRVSVAYVDAVPDGRAVQVFCQTKAGTARVVAVVSNRSVRRSLRDQYVVVAATALALLLLAWVAAEITGRRITRPLQRTAGTATRLSEGDLTARAPVDGHREVARVAVELNALADRISELLTQEREAAADLSHRLRTPLTAVRLSVEGLPPGRARDDLEAGVDALERTLTQVIRAARRGVRGGLHPRCDAVAVTSERVAFWRPLAEDQERALTVSLPTGQVWVRLAEEDLASALDALIENVIAHTPEGTDFAVRLTRTGQGADLDVSDDGPGISEPSLARGRSDRGSSGLGLDIAREAAGSTGGGLDLLPDGPGGHVRLRLLGEA